MFVYKLTYVQLYVIINDNVIVLILQAICISVVCTSVPSTPPSLLIVY